MASNQKLEIEIAGNTVQLERSMKSINAILQASKAEATSLNRELKFDPTNTELLEKRQKALTTAMEMSKERASELRKDLEKIDPQVNPEGFVKLSRQVNAAESQTRSFERQLTATASKLSELSNRSGTFKFDPGTGAREFSNTLKGVDAALSTIATKKLANFDSSKASANDVAKAVGRIGEAVSLTERKAELLRNALNRVDARVNPEQFAKLQNKLNDANNATSALREKQNELVNVLGRVNNAAKSFHFDAGDGAKKFTNDLQGLNNAIRGMDTHKLLNFNAGEASIREAKATMQQLGQTTELTMEKARRLREAMKHLDPESNPEAFKQLKRELQEVTQQLLALNRKKIEIKVETGKDFSKIFDRARADTSKAFENIGAVGGEKLTSSASSKLQEGVGRIGQALEKVASIGQDFARAGLSAGKTLISNILSAIGSGSSKILSSFSKVGSGLKSLFSSSALVAGGELIAKLVSAIGSGVGKVASVASSVGSRIGSALANAAKSSVSTASSVFSSVGKSAVDAIKKPFETLGAGLVNVTRGALMTVGMNITNSVSSQLRGLYSVMNETQRQGTALSNVLSFSGVDDSNIKNITKDLQDYAKSTTYNASEAYKAEAALTGVGVSADKASKLVKAMGNSYALLGDGSQKLSQVNIILSQINSAGKLMAQDFNQLRNAGLGGAIAQEIKKIDPAIKDFSKAMSDGKISADMVNQAIENIGNSDAAKKAAFVPKTIGEAFDALQETIGKKFQDVFKSLNDQGINFVQNITDAIDDMDVTPIAMKINQAVNLIIPTIKQAAAFGSTIADGIFAGFGSPLAKANIATAKANIASLNNIDFGGLTSKFVQATTLLLPPIAKLINIVSGIVTSVNFDALLGKLTIVEQATMRMLNTLNIAPVLNAVASAFNNLTTGSNIVGFFNTLTVTIQNVINAISQINLNGLLSGLVGLGKTAFDVFNSLLPVVVNLANGAITAFSEIARNIKNALSQINLNELLSALVSVGRTVADVFTALLPTFVTVANVAISAFSQIANYLSSSGFADAFNNVASAVGKFVSALNISGVLTAVEHVIGSLAGALNSLDLTTVSNLFVTFGRLSMSAFDKLLPVVVTVTNAIISAFNGIMNVVTSVISKINFDQLLSSFATLANALSTAFSGIDLTGLLTLIVNIINMLISGFTDFVNMLNSTVAPALKSVFGNINFDAINSKLTFLTNSFKSAFDSIDFSPVSDNIKNGLKDVDVSVSALDISTVFQKGADAIQAVVNALGKIDLSTLTGAFEKLGKTIGDAFGKSNFNFSDILGAVVGIVNFAILQFSSLVDWMSSDSFKGGVSTVWNDIKGVVQTVGDTIKSIFDNIDFDKMKESGQSLVDLFKSIQDFFKGELVDSLLDSTARVIAGLINVASDAAKQLSDISADVLDIFKDIDVSGIGDSLVTAFKAAGDGMVEALKPVKTSLDDIKNTDFSSTMNTYVKNSLGSFDSLLKILAPIVSAIGSLTGANLGYHFEIFGGAINGILKVANPFIDFIKYLKDNFKPLGDVIKVVAEQFGRIMVLLGKGIGKKLSEFGDVIAKTLKPAFDGLKKSLDPVFETVNKMLKSLSKYAKAGGDAIAKVIEKTLGVSEHSLSGVSTNSIGNYDYSASNVQNNTTTNHVTMTVTGQDGTSILDIARAVKHELELGTV